MAAINVARTVLFAAIAASRSPMVRAAIRNAPKMVRAEHKAAALEVSKRAARKAGEMTARVIPPNKFF